MARVKTYTASSPTNVVLPGELNSMQDSYETVYGGWHPLLHFSGFRTPSGAAKYNMTPFFGGTNELGQSQPGIFYFDPADHAASPRALRLKLAARVTPNTTAPGINFTYAMSPITAVAGTGGTQMTVTYGTDVTGSSISIPNPTVSTAGSADFAAPTAGFFAITMSTSGVSLGQYLSSGILMYRLT